MVNDLPADYFAAIEIAAPDPILGVTEAFEADDKPAKVNLSLGVYCDATGRVPLLDCVRYAEAIIAENRESHTYLPIEGLRTLVQAVPALVLGQEAAADARERTVAIQTIGSSGALRLGADLLRRAQPAARVWISDPSWTNHRAIFEGAGFEVRTYPYYDPAARNLDMEGLLLCLSEVPAGDVILLHACCHNPTGVDLSADDQAIVTDLIASRRLIPFVDMAYQGFGDGLDTDRSIVEQLAQAGGPLLVSNSFSKSLSLYGERLGALTVVAQDGAAAARIRGVLKSIVRMTYSSPPAYGAQIAANVLLDPDLRRIWERELFEMRHRIGHMRKVLVDWLSQLIPENDFGYILRQKGLFSYSHLPPSVLQRLRQESSIYTVANGRLCVASLNSRNIEYVARAIARACAVEPCVDVAPNRALWLPVVAE